MKPVQESVPEGPPLTDALEELSSLEPRQKRLVDIQPAKTQEVKLEMPPVEVAPPAANGGTTLRGLVGLSTADNRRAPRGAIQRTSGYGRALSARRVDVPSTDGREDAGRNVCVCYRTYIRVDYAIHIRS